MNLDGAQAVRLAGQLARAPLPDDLDVVICPPHVYLQAVGQAIADAPIALGAQNLYDRGNGAFTGEISAAMLCDVGCRYVIVGHSERRHLIGETNDMVNRKALAALAAGLVPIVCLGETLEERRAGRTRQVLEDQFDGSLASLSEEQVRGLVIAYEPVWAIGTGVVATPDEATAVHQDLRNLLAIRYNPVTAAQIRILYGGSVKADNAGRLLGEPDIDGALVGGASLEAQQFLAIIQAGAGIRTTAD
jgi:triosephosphate isomerase